MICLLGIVMFAAGFAGLEGHKCDWSDADTWNANITAVFYNTGLFLLVNSPVAPAFMVIRHALVWFGVVRWHIPVMLFTAASWLVLTAIFTVVDMSQSSGIYPSLVLLSGGLIGSCGPNLAVFLAERWGVQWVPGPRVNHEVAIIAVGTCLASIAGCLAVGVVSERAVRCA